MRLAIGWFGKVRTLKSKILPEIKKAHAEGLRLNNPTDIRELRSRLRAPIIHLQRNDCPGCNVLITNDSSVWWTSSKHYKHGMLLQYWCGHCMTEFYMYVPGSATEQEAALALYHGPKGVS